jgi:hypothetical protein
VEGAPGPFELHPLPDVKQFSFQWVLGKISTKVWLVETKSRGCLVPVDFPWILNQIHTHCKLSGCKRPSTDQSKDPTSERTALVSFRSILPWSGLGHMKPSDHCLLCLHFHVLGNGSKVGIPSKLDGWIIEYQKMYMGVWKWSVTTKLRFQYIEKMMLWTMVFLGVYPIFRYHNHKGISLFNQIFRYFDSMDFRQNLYRDTSKLLSTSIASNSLSKSIDTSKSSSISTVHISPKVYQFLSRSSKIYQILWTSPTFFKRINIYGYQRKLSKIRRYLPKHWPKPVDPKFSTVEFPNGGGAAVARNWRWECSAKVSASWYPNCWINIGEKKRDHGAIVDNWWLMVGT